MTIEKYFIKDDYFANNRVITIDETSGGQYWNESRINSSYYYQFLVYRCAKKLIQEKNIKQVIDVGRGIGTKLAFIHNNLPGIDIVADIEDGLDFIPDGSVDEIYSHSVLEHIENFEKLMSEIVRVLKKDRRVFAYILNFSSPYYYSDPTHKRFFGLYTFYYFVDSKHQLKRKVPKQYFDTKKEIVSQKLIFNSSFLFRKIVKKIVGVIFNLNRFTQELCEEKFCYIFPCNGIEIVFTKDE